MNQSDDQLDAPGSSRLMMAFKVVATFVVVLLLVGTLIKGTSILEEKRAFTESMQMNVNSSQEARLASYCEEKARTARKIGGTIICADEYGRLYDVFAAR